MALGPTSARDKQEPFKQESVRFDVQAKTALERLRAATNIGSVVYDQSQVLTATQGLRAWNNMGADETRGGNGYIRLPSGFIVQWGVVNSWSSDGAATLTFPIAFPTAQIAFVATAGSAWGGSNQLRSVYYEWSTNLSSRELFMRSQTGTGGVTPTTNANARWIALGY